MNMLNGNVVELRGVLHYDIHCRLMATTHDT